MGIQLFSIAMIWSLVPFISAQHNAVRILLRCANVLVSAGLTLPCKSAKLKIETYTAHLCKWAKPATKESDWFSLARSQPYGVFPAQLAHTLLDQNKN